MMTLDALIVTTSSFHSRNKQDLINSNNLYVTRLFQHQLTEDKIFQDALLCYYLDFYESHITHGGFYNFIESYYNKTKVIYYIHSALESMKSKKHLQLFKKVFKGKTFENSKMISESLDEEFKKIQTEEYLTNLNYEWLRKHPKLNIVPNNDFEKYVRLRIFHAQDEKRHIQIIKQLCKLINEEFVTITAGDKNNIYMQSWYFKTTKNHYFFIEKSHIVTLYNSFSKEVILKGRLIVNKTDESIISNLISRILA
jgi:hypothetical protein